MPKTKRLTKKEREFYKKYFKTGNGTKAALYAYDTDDEATAASIAYENLRKPQIISAINTLMDKEGLTDKKLLKVLKEGLEASKVISAYVIHGDADEKTNDFIDVPDYSARQRYLKLALELKKLLDKADINIDKSKHTYVNIWKDIKRKAQEVEDNEQSRSRIKSQKEPG